MTAPTSLSACPTCFRPLPLAVGPVVVHLDASCNSRGEFTGAVTAHDGQDLALTRSEFAFFATLVRAQGVVVGRELMSQSVLGRPWRPEDRCLDQLALKMRRKLPPGEDGLPMVRTIHGEGFWLRPPSGRMAPAALQGASI